MSFCLNDYNIQHRIAQIIVNIKPHQFVNTSSFEDIQTKGVAEQ
jgi:hypothetical protein